MQIGLLAQASVPLAVCTDTVLGLVGGAPGRRHLEMSKPALFQFVLKIGATNFDTSGKLPGPLLEPQLRLARGYLFRSGWSLGYSFVLRPTEPRNDVQPICERLPSLH